jgi:hypothetical protein
MGTHCFDTDSRRWIKVGTATWQCSAERTSLEDAVTDYRYVQILERLAPFRARYRNSSCNFLREASSSVQFPEAEFRRMRQVLELESSMRRTLEAVSRAKLELLLNGQATPGRPLGTGEALKLHRLMLLTKLSWCCYANFVLRTNFVLLLRIERVRKDGEMSCGDERCLVQKVSVFVNSNRVCYVNANTNQFEA